MEHPPFFITPMISVHNDELYMYGRLEWVYDKPAKSKNSLLNLQNNQHHNKLSQKAKSKAKRAVKYLLFSAHEKKVFNPKYNSSFKFKVGFITLTLPSMQIHTDQEIKSICLNQFLIEARKKWNMSNYVWKAEKQGNGNIHFHILTDVFIPHWELRVTWNRIVEKLGYVTRYNAVHHKKNPNSTDIHSLYKIKNIYDYVTKYMTKNDKRNRSQVLRKDSLYIRSSEKCSKSISSGAKAFLGKLNSCGKIWACSTTLSNLTGGQDELSEAYQKEIEKILQAKRSKRIDKDYVTCIYFDSTTINQVDTPLLFELLNSFLHSKFRMQSQSITYPPLPLS
jgi:hypothetical protein